MYCRSSKRDFLKTEIFLIDFFENTPLKMTLKNSHFHVLKTLKLTNWSKFPVLELKKNRKTEKTSKKVSVGNTQDFEFFKNPVLACRLTPFSNCCSQKRKMTLFFEVKMPFFNHHVHTPKSLRSRYKTPDLTLKTSRKP